MPNPPATAAHHVEHEMKPLPHLAIVLSLTALSIALGACSSTGRVPTTAHSQDLPRVPQVATLSSGSTLEVANTEAQEQKHIATFDDLDFNVFSNQKWDELSHSHTADVIVHWPDGRVTQRIDVHINDLKRLFVHAPDTRIKQHPHRIAQSDLTAVSGLMEGTLARDFARSACCCSLPVHLPAHRTMPT